MGEIHLVRHARSAYVHDGRWRLPAGVREFEHAYDAAGILDEPAPPASLVALAARADVLAASDMARAIASAERLAPGRAVTIRPELRELNIRAHALLPIPLPLLVWGTLDFALWTVRMAVGGENEGTRRADAAAAWLMEAAAGGRTVLAVTHGAIRRLIDLRLRARGCKAIAGPRGYANWGSWSYNGG